MLFYFSVLVLLLLVGSLAASAIQFVQNFLARKATLKDEEKFDHALHKMLIRQSEEQNDQSPLAEGMVGRLN